MATTVKFSTDHRRFLTFNSMSDNISGIYDSLEVLAHTPRLADDWIVASKSLELTCPETLAFVIQNGQKHSSLLSQSALSNAAAINKKTLLILGWLSGHPTISLEHSTLSHNQPQDL